MKSNSLKSLSSKTAIFFAASLILGLSQASLSKADLIQMGGSFDLGEGFGNSNNILTFQNSGGAGTASDIEEGGVSWNGANVYTEDADTNPNKTATFSFSDLGITDASQILFVWNPDEVGNTAGKQTQIDELRMDIYAPAGGSIFDASLAAPVHFDDLFNPGVGGGDFVFGLDAAQSTTLQGILEGIGDFSAYRIGLYSSASFVDAGPDTWIVGKVTGESPGPVPEPMTMLLFATGLGGLATVTRRKKK